MSRIHPGIVNMTVDMTQHVCHSHLGRHLIRRRLCSAGLQNNVPSLTVNAIIMSANLSPSQDITLSRVSGSLVYCFNKVPYTPHAKDAGSLLWTSIFDEFGDTLLFSPLAIWSLFFKAFSCIVRTSQCWSLWKNMELKTKA